MPNFDPLVLSSIDKVDRDNPDVAVALREIVRWANQPLRAVSIAHTTNAVVANTGANTQLAFLNTFSYHDPYGLIDWANNRVDLSPGWWMIYYDAFGDNHARVWAEVWHSTVSVPVAQERIYDDIVGANTPPAANLDASAAGLVYIPASISKSWVQFMASSDASNPGNTLVSMTSIGIMYLGR